ncbi:MAG: hypothetical protein NTY45_11965 [Elusimicrobia bacterium]|nr:hypothetical protein [Elusimicrobiota bacterium]
MYKVLFILAAGLLQAAAGQQAADEEPERQDRCFCVKYVGGFQRPYYLIKLKPATPRCRELKYTPGPELPFYEGLLTCDELLACRGAEQARAEEKKALEQKIEEAKKKLYDCCQSGPAYPAACAPKCAAKWKRALKVLAAEKKRRETSINEACIPKSRKVQKTE